MRGAASLARTEANQFVSIDTAAKASIKNALLSNACMPHYLLTSVASGLPITRTWLSIATQRSVKLLLKSLHEHEEREQDENHAKYTPDHGRYI